MKKLAALALTGLLMTGTAFAGGVKEEVIEPAEAGPTSSSAGGILVPLLLVLVVGAVVASGGGKGKNS